MIQATDLAFSPVFIFYQDNIFNRNCSFFEKLVCLKQIKDKFWLLMLFRKITKALDVSVDDLLK